VDEKGDVRGEGALGEGGEKVASRKPSREDARVMNLFHEVDVEGRGGEGERFGKDAKTAAGGGGRPTALLSKDNVW